MQIRRYSLVLAGLITVAVIFAASTALFAEPLPGSLQIRLGTATGAVRSGAALDANREPPASAGRRCHQGARCGGGHCQTMKTYGRASEGKKYRRAYLVGLRRSWRSCDVTFGNF